MKRMPEPVRLSLIAMAIILAAVGLLAWSPLLTPDDATLARAGISISLLRVPLALGSLWLVLRIMDWVTGWKFADVRTILESNPHATAIYQAGRFVGVCLLLAAIYS